MVDFVTFATRVVLSPGLSGCSVSGPMSPFSPGALPGQSGTTGGSEDGDVLLAAKQPPHGRRPGQLAEPTAGRVVVVGGDAGPEVQPSMDGRGLRGKVLDKVRDAQPAQLVAG